MYCKFCNKIPARHKNQTPKRAFFLFNCYLFYYHKSKPKEKTWKDWMFTTNI